MIEIKTPHAGEYWLSGSSLIAYIVGFTIDGDPAWQQKGSRQILSDEMQFFLACFHYEPRCDSFDWVEPPAEVWPKYYAPIMNSNGYYRCEAENDVWHVCSYETVPKHWTVSKLRNTAVWKEITEAEALARVTPVAVDPATKALHDLAIHAGFDPLGLDPCDIAEKLIAEHQAPPQRVPVRLFMDDRNNMFAVRGEWPIIVGTQIKHDAGGFYVTEGER